MRNILTNKDCYLLKIVSKIDSSMLNSLQEPAKIEVHWLHKVTTCHDMSETEFVHLRRKYNCHYFLLDPVYVFEKIIPYVLELY